MILAFLLGCAALQEPPPPAPKHKIEAKLAIEEEAAKGAWRFVVSGTTDLPDGAILQGELDLVDEFDDYKGGKREGEEMMLDRRNTRFPKCTVAAGAFQAVLFHSLRAPFSFRYRAKIRYEIGSQQGELATVVGDPDFEARAELDRRDADRLDREFREGAQTILFDLDAMLKRFSELQENFVKQRRDLEEKKFVRAEWEVWKKAWHVRLREVADRNDKRWELKNAWVEREGKARIEMLIGMLRHVVLEICDPYFAGKTELLPQAQQAFDAFVQDYSAAIDGLGIDAPFDLARVNDQLTVYSATFAEIASMAAAKDAVKWSARVEALRGQARRALLRLSDPKVVPRRGYEVLADLTAACNGIFAAGDALFRGTGNAEAFGELLRQHDAKLKELRALAEKGERKP